jgi:predicted ATPase
METEGGFVFEIIGDAFSVAFPSPAGAVRAAARAQQDLNAEPWGDAPIRVRMGIHTGEAEAVEGHYRGYLALSSVQRIMSAGHGGQVLLSPSTFELAQEGLPDGVTTRDLGTHRLKDLQRPQQLFQLVLPNLPSDFPALRTLDLRPHNLPIQLTSFVGRDRELREITDLLHQARLVTLTGVGGSGKTRLALQVGAEMLQEFPDGVWLVELAPLADPDRVPEAVAAALSVHEAPGHPLLELLRDFLRTKHLLILLDNCEHLIEACAHVADDLLRAGAGVRILATSREALAIAGESAFQLQSLSLPASAAPSAAEAAPAEAVRLFCERASAARPGFALDDQNASSIVRICQRLDGIPLALELAAPLVRGLGPEQIAARLDDRFRLLTGGSRTALPRQRTLQAAIDWSYKLLSDQERLLLRRLAAFSGGWRLEAAESVCGTDALDRRQILDLQLRLIEKSLVISDVTAKRPRYQMLETIRQYAQERLDESGETEGIRRRHATYFVEWAEGMAIELRAGPTQLQRFEELKPESGNIEAALAWSLEGGDAELGLRLGGTIFYYWWRGGHWREWERWMHLAEGRLGGASEVTRAAALVALCGANYYVTRDPERARQQAEEALSIFRRLGNDQDTAWANIWLNVYYDDRVTDADEYARCVARAEESLRLFQASANKAGVAQALTGLGIMANMRGDMQRAREAGEQALAIAREIGDQIRVEIQLMNLGSVALRTGDYERAGSLYRDGLLSAWSRRNLPSTLSALATFVLLAIARHRRPRAVRLLGAVEAFSENTGVRLQPTGQIELDRDAAPLRPQLGDEVFEALLAEGRAMTIEQAIEYTLREEDI